MEQMSQTPRRPEAQEKSEMISSEIRSKRMTSELAPEHIEATFTVETFSKLNPGQITVDDRGYVYTASGNVYRIDRSRSRPTLLKFFNQNKGNETDYAVPAPGRSQTIQVGSPMFYGILNNPDDLSGGVHVANSTDVTKIEIWRNYLKAEREIESDLQKRHGGGGLGGVMAKALAGAVRGTIRQRNYTKRNSAE